MNKKKKNLECQMISKVTDSSNYQLSSQTPIQSDSLVYKSETILEISTK